MVEANKSFGDPNNALVQKLKTQVAGTLCPTELPLESTKKLVLWCTEEFSMHSPQFMEDIELLKSLLDRITSRVSI